MLPMLAPTTNPNQDDQPRQGGPPRDQGTDMTETKTITPTQDVKNNLARMKRHEGESDEDFAIRKYNTQMEIYSAWAGMDLWRPFWNLPKETRDGWLDKVKDQK